MASDPGDKRMHVVLSESDREALAFIKRTHGGSHSAIIRASIRAAAIRLGFGQLHPDDLEAH